MTSFLKEASEFPIVETSLGKAKGKTLEKVEGGKNVFLFTGLPFAKPPIGDLRFELPVSPDPWDGILDATKHSAAPVQDKKMLEAIIQFMPYSVDRDPETFDEDCLYLSVYTPNPSPTANLPVLFWIHGGGFLIGGEYDYDGSVLASLHDVVVVIPNYRLSVLGFLALGNDTDYPGNMGLHDQIMALKWTQNHIKSFGGNPEKVTLFGESAGGMSVSFHVVSPLSKGLFHQAISHSGTFFSTGYPMDSLEKPSKALLEQLKIEETEPNAVIKKLKSFSTEEMFSACETLGESFNYFGPISDGKFFPKALPVMKKEPVVNNVPYIVGCNNSEGSGIMTVITPQGFTSGLTKKSLLESLKGFLGTTFCDGLPDAGYEMLIKEYEKDKNADDRMKWSKIYGEILADLVFVGPTIEAVKQHVASNGKSYMYVMTQQPQFNHTGPEKVRKVDFCECDHGDDILFTFGVPLSKEKLTFDPKWTEDEKQLSREWMKYIANFATNGDPNIGLPVKVKWPEYKMETKEHLFVHEPCSTGKNFGLKNNEFLRDVVEPMRVKSSN